MAEPNWEEGPGRQVPRKQQATLLSPDRHRVVASSILGTTKGKQMKIDKPTRLEKYLFLQDLAIHRETGTTILTDIGTVPTGTEPPAAPTVSALVNKTQYQQRKVSESAAIHLATLQESKAHERKSAHPSKASCPQMWYSE